MTFEEARKYWNTQLECTEYMLEEHLDDNVSKDECNAHIEYIEAMKCAIIALEMYCESNQDGQYGRLTIADALHKLLIEGGDYDE